MVEVSHAKEALRLPRRGGALTRTCSSTPSAATATRRCRSRLGRFPRRRTSAGRARRPRFELERVEALSCEPRPSALRLRPARRAARILRAMTTGPPPRVARPRARSPVRSATRRPRVNTGSTTSSCTAARSAITASRTWRRSNTSAATTASGRRCTRTGSRTRTSPCSSWSRRRSRRHKPEATVIDIGAGRGELLSHLREHNPRLGLTGLDASLQPEIQASRSSVRTSTRRPRRSQVGRRRSPSRRSSTSPTSGRSQTRLRSLVVARAA